jgi:hypothetical protein
MWSGVMPLQASAIAAGSVMSPTRRGISPPVGLASKPCTAQRPFSSAIV